MATPPTLSQTYTSAWNTTTTPKTQSITAAAGDVLVCAITAAIDSGASFSAPTGGSGISWAFKGSDVTTDNCMIAVYTATVASGQTFTLSVANPSAGNDWGFQVTRWAGSSGIGAVSIGHTSNGSGGVFSQSITTTAANSALYMLAGDFWESVITSRVWRTVNGITPTSGNGAELAATRVSGNYTVFAAYWSDAGATGSKTTGMTTPATVGAGMVTVEIKGSGGAVQSGAGTATITMGRSGTAILSQRASGTRSILMSAHGSAVVGASSLGSGSASIIMGASGSGLVTPTIPSQVIAVNLAHVKYAASRALLVFAPNGDADDIRLQTTVGPTATVAVDRNLSPIPFKRAAIIFNAKGEPSDIRLLDAFGDTSTIVADQGLHEIAGKRALLVFNAAGDASDILLEDMPLAVVPAPPDAHPTGATVVLPTGLIPVRVPTRDEILQGNRFTRFRFDILTSSEALKGTLDGVQDGSFNWISNAAVKGAGILTIKARGQNIDWLNDRIRPWICINGLPDEPLGIFLASDEPSEWSDTGQVLQMGFLDKTSLLDADVTEETYALPAGTVITDKVAEIVSNYTNNYVITPSTATLPNALVWDPATSWLKIVNNLLSVANYFSLYADYNGALRGDPYVVPAKRPITYEFIDGEEPGRKSIYAPDFKREKDIFKIPNKVVVTSMGNGVDAALSSVAFNNNPDSPYSIANRNGRIVSYPETGVEIADQATLDAYAQRLLIAKTSPAARVELLHGWVPGMKVNDAVRFRRVPAGIDARHVVSQLSVAVNATVLAQSTFTEVVDL